MNIECTACGVTLKAADSAIGRRAKCPRCAATFRVTAPVIATETVDPPAASDGIDDDLLSAVSGGPRGFAPRQAVQATTWYGEGVSGVRQRATVIEQTDKAFKAHMLIGILIAAVGGIILLAADNSARQAEFRPAAMIVIGVGVAWFAFAKGLAWWNHG